MTKLPQIVFVPKPKANKKTKMRKTTKRTKRIDSRKLLPAVTF